MAIQKQTRLTLIVDAGIVEQVLQVLTGIADLSHQDFKIAVEEIASDNLKDLSSEVVNSGDKVVNSEDRGMSSWGEDYSPEEDSLAKEDPEMELLHTEKALRMLQALRDIQLLDEDFQPLHLSWAQKGYLAYQIAFKLDIAHVWVVMGAFWHLSAKALKSGRNRAMNMPLIIDFDKKIKPILG